MKKIRLIATDLDGTLLTDDKRISDGNMKAISEAVKQGIFFVPATGRSLYTMPENVLNVPGLRYAVTSNGAAVMDVINKTAVYKKQLDTLTAKNVVKVGLDMGIMVEIFVNGKAYTLSKYMGSLVEYGVNPRFVGWLIDTRTVVNDFSEVLKKDVTVENINLIYTNLEQRMVTYDYLQKNFDVEITNSLGYNLEVGAKGCSKGDALEHLSALLGFGMENVLCLGDNDNDRDMLRRAGISVAMENAHDIVKKEAAFVAKNNNDDGFAEAVRKFALI